MKIKVILLVGLGIIGFGSLETQAISLIETPRYEYNDDVNMPNGFDKIDLLGSLMYGTGPNAIIAGASDDAVYIGFNQDFGNVNISIYNGMGVLVYSTVVNTATQSEIIIPFHTAASGTYIVELNNAAGYADGEFDHD